MDAAADDVREKKLTELERSCSDIFTTFNKKATEQRFIIGDNFFAHFGKYMGLLHSRSEALEQARTAKSPGERKISDDYINAINHLLATMQFWANGAREFAPSPVP